jgi:protein MpaA
MRLVRRVRPRLALYYHQHLGLTVRAKGADPALQREYARRTGLPLRSLPDYRGTAIGWENHEVREGSAFVVELRAGRAPVKTHVAAVRALAKKVAMARAAARRPVATRRATTCCPATRRAAAGGCA